MQKSRRQKVLILTEWFVPGFLAGGPIRSCFNFAYAMRTHFDILVLTTNQDFGVQEPYPGIAIDKWIEIEEGIKVCYLPRKDLSYRTIRRYIKAAEADFIYLNSMFSFYFSVIPLTFCWFEKCKGQVILAPRGMLHAGALKYKRLKKKFLLQIFQLLGVYKKIRFQATDEQEKTDIICILNISDYKIDVIPNPPVTPLSEVSPFIKERGKIKMVFISRVAPKKNLKYFLQLLLRVKQNDHVELTIIGGDEDGYWVECQKVISSFQQNIKINYLGPLRPSALNEQLLKHHFFVLPTHGENFGHAIFESFAVGRPVLISDQTPWRDLEEKKIGFDLPLDDTEGWISALNQIIHMDQKEYDQWCQNALDYAHEFVETSNLKERYLQLFS